MKIREAVTEYRFSILDHSEATQDWTRKKLGRFISWCEVQGLELEDIKPMEVRRFIEELKHTPNKHNGTEPLSSHTIHGHARIIRTFLNWCYSEEFIEKQRKITMPHLEKKVIETLTPDQIRAMFNATEQEYTQEMVKRDQAILSVLLDTGIRASELCDLTLENVHIDNLDAYIKLHGKGNKWREVGLGKQSRALLYRYIHRYRTTPKDNSYVFLTRYKEQMTPNGLNQTLYGSSAGSLLSHVVY